MGVPHFLYLLTWFHDLNLKCPSLAYVLVAYSLMVVLCVCVCVQVQVCSSVSTHALETEFHYIILADLELIVRAGCPQTPMNS